jgi:hypothetical protein
MLLLTAFGNARDAADVNDDDDDDNGGGGGGGGGSGDVGFALLLAQAEAQLTTAARSALGGMLLRLSLYLFVYLLVSMFSCVRFALLLAQAEAKLTTAARAA